MKDELDGKLITEFAALRPKTNNLVVVKIKKQKSQKKWVVKWKGKLKFKNIAYKQLNLKMI